eukprot:1170894-Rhodomonas_salina.2
MTKGCWTLSRTERSLWVPWDQHSAMSVLGAGFQDECRSSSARTTYTDHLYSCCTAPFICTVSASAIQLQQYRIRVPCTPPPSAHTSEGIKPGLGS